MNNFYVYAHYNPIKKEVFYIGKGKDKRAYVKSRNKHWKNIVNKYGYEVQFIATDLSEIEAHEMEIKLIKDIGRRITKTGPLINRTTGGEGASGIIPTKKTRDKIRITLKGRPLDETRKNKIAKSLTKGNSIISETILNERSKNNHWRSGIPSSNSRVIEQYNLSGKLINEFPSIIEAKLKTNISHINRALIKNKPVCGYIFKYKE